MKFRLLLALAAFLQPICAQDAGAPTAFPRFRLLKGDVDADGLPTSGAKLCLLPPLTHCYQLPSDTPSDSSQVTYQFGLDPRSERLTLKDGSSLVFFSATFSGGGSGTLDRLAILRYKAGEIVNLLPFAALTNQSGRAMWQLPDVSPYPILATADFVWDLKANETHFAAHRYSILVFRFNLETGRYVEALNYVTAGKFHGLDERAKVRVLAHERPEIMKRLTVHR